MRTAWWVAGIVLVALIARLVLVFSQPEFSVDETYDRLRNAQSIIDTGLPVIEDPLGVRSFVFPNALDYLLAGLGSMLGLVPAAKILASLLFASFVALVAVFVCVSTSDKPATVLAGIGAALIPALWTQAFSLEVPLLGIALGMAFLVCHLKIDRPRWRAAFLAVTVVASVASPVLFVFVFGAVIAEVLGWLAGDARPRGSGELLLFSILFPLWATLVLYKAAFSAHGLAVFWQNTPSEVLSTYFTGISVLDAVAAVGPVTFVASLVAMHRTLFKQSRESHLAIGLASAVGILLWLRLIRLPIGLSILGLACAVLFGLFVHDLRRFALGARFTYAAPLVVAGLALLLAATVPTTIGEAEQAAVSTLQPADLETLNWIADGVARDGIIAAAPADAAVIAFKAQRRSVADTSFLLESRPGERIHALRQIFTAPFESEAVSALDRYDARHVLWTDRTRAFASRESPPFATDTHCFPVVFAAGNSVVYESRCSVES